MEEKEPIALLLDQNPFWCPEEECKDHDPFIRKEGLSRHLKIKHGMTLRQYAEKNKTGEWLICETCGKGCFRSFSWQADHHEYFICIDSKCPSRQEIINSRAKKFKQWCKENPEKIKEMSEKGKKTLKEGGGIETLRNKAIQRHKNHPNAASEAGFIGWETRRANGNVESGVEHMLQWYEEHPEQKKLYIIKATEARKANGGYRYEVMSKINKKRAKTGRKTLFEKLGIYSLVFPTFSLESQELFWTIEQKLSEKLTCYYAMKQNELFGTILENGHRTSGEFQVWVHGNAFCRFLDFYIKELNVCIEFDEESHEKEESIKKDIIRENDIKRAIPTIKILRIKKRDFLADKDKVLKECLDFIHQCIEQTPRVPQSTERVAEQEVP